MKLLTLFSLVVVSCVCYHNTCYSLTSPRPSPNPPFSIIKETFCLKRFMIYHSDTSVKNCFSVEYLQGILILACFIMFLLFQWYVLLIDTRFVKLNTTLNLLHKPTPKMQKPSSSNSLLYLIVLVFIMPELHPHTSYALLSTFLPTLKMPRLRWKALLFFPQFLNGLLVLQIFSAATTQIQHIL